MFHGFSGVLEEIYQNLLYLNSVDHDSRQAPLDGNPHFNATFLGMICPRRIASSTVCAISSLDRLGPRFSTKLRKRRMMFPARVACSATFPRIDFISESPRSSAASRQALV